MRGLFNCTKIEMRPTLSSPPSAALTTSRSLQPLLLMTRFPLMKSSHMLLALLALIPVAHSNAELPPLISREVLFGNPERTAPALSPDGTRVAIRMVGASGADTDVWIADLERKAYSRLTFTGTATDPVWTPDGKRVCYEDFDVLMCQPFLNSSIAFTASDDVPALLTSSQITSRPPGLIRR